MKKALILIGLLVAASAQAATYTDYYQDTAKDYYRAPAEVRVAKNGAAWNASNFSFANSSSAAGPNVAGEVQTTFVNVTATGCYSALWQDSLGVAWKMSVCHTKLNDLSAAQVNAEVDTALADYDAPTNTEMLAAFRNLTGDLSDQHGVGAWTSSGSGTTLIMTPLDGAIEYGDPKTSSSELPMYAGDTVNLPYRVLNADGTAFDLTGYTVKMAAKRNLTDSKYAIGATTTTARDITADVDSPATLGTGLIKLAHADTSSLSPGRYIVDVKIYLGSQEVTSSRLYLTIQTPVIH